MEQPQREDGRAAGGLGVWTVLVPPWPRVTHQTSRISQPCLPNPGCASDRVRNVHHVNVTWKRPRGLPRRIPAWVWKWLKWRTRKHAPKPPAPKPAPTPTPAPTPAPKPKPPVPFKALEGVDGVSVPTGAQLRAAGKHFAGRYLSPPYSTGPNPKDLTKAQAADLHKAGLGIVLFYESTGKSFLGGHAAGQHDAGVAHQRMRALGIPLSNRDGSPVAVYFTIDEDPHGHEAVIVDYIRGAASIMGIAHTGVYGGLAAVTACSKTRACRFFCQAYAWSGGLWSLVRHLEQYQNGVHLDGHTVDLDRQVKPVAGLWLP